MEPKSSSLRANRFSPYNRPLLKKEVKDEEDFETVELLPAGPIPHFQERIEDPANEEPNVKDGNEESTWEERDDAEYVEDEEEDEDFYAREVSQDDMENNPGEAVSSNHPPRI
jgi:hypothetical protein